MFFEKESKNQNQTESFFDGLLSVISGNTLFKCIIGIVMGLFAVLFLSYYRVIFKFFNKTLKKIRHGWRILFAFVITFAAGLCSFSFISTGHELILELFDRKTTVIMLLLLLIVRSSITLCANANRVTGGIFLPLLAVGAIVASIIARTFEATLNLDKSYYSVILVLGIVACIAGMMKMPLTAIVFAVEALSCYDNILYIIIVSGVTYIITEIFGAESINDRVLEYRVEEMNEGKTPSIIDRYVTVREGTFALGMHVRDIFWPCGLFVLSHKHTLPIDQRDKHAIKALHEGDILHVRCSTFDLKQTEDELEAIIGPLGDEN